MILAIYPDDSTIYDQMKLGKTKKKFHYIMPEIIILKSYI